ncbi:ABC transporter ATP-binding protein [Streptomyces turgidiscabies]|uniref:ABC transporter, ATP-binding protein n=1 Tax=Streptomyces turgidiscabies (strain Car8) TaxID=698760 RepID=L7F856_STRT8|nr:MULTISPECIES: ATP-binding cassette domain-containing protein [Streptomyces]ELP67778.1 ABC transporter, ATP-binding protein [Streptomyces turgidiscabies Car8]MDX3496570.1 ATP-binding cassette domain-containing protein [Streptomyces turgidiscabies]GAQ72766.1 glutathione import ATP-binding protein GsiA [Streptomyces turgidiscabies]
MTGTPILQVDGLAVRYPSRGWRKPPTTVIEDVSFEVGRAETVALVGESGSGKTTIGRAVLGLTPVSGGHVLLDGRDITSLSGHTRRALSTDIQAIFQNPYGSLNPALPVGRTLAEPLLTGSTHSRGEVREHITDLLRRVGLPEDAADRYPAQFSGGQRQRIAIARAVARQPKLIICDEPTSALDVTTQAAALDLLSELQQSLGCAYLFITHDLAVVKEFAARTLVLQNGRIVEEGRSTDVCDQPQHEYTQRLVAAAPVPDPVLQRQRRQRRMSMETAAS